MGGHHQVTAKATELTAKTNKCKTSATAQLIQDINLFPLLLTKKENYTEKFTKNTFFT